MIARRWIQVFALTLCLIRTAKAGQEDLNKFGTTTINSGPEIVRISTELQLSPEGNLVTRCFVSRVSADLRQLRTPSKPLSSEVPPQTSPPQTCSPTPVYDSESLFGALRGDAGNVSSIQEAAKNYFVTDNEESLSKAEVLGVIFNAILSGSEQKFVAAINALKTQLKSGGLSEEKPKTVVVCLPDGGSEEKEVIDNCTDIEMIIPVGRKEVKSSVAALDSSSTPQSELPPHEKEKVCGDGQHGMKTVIDLLKGNTSAPGNKRPETVADGAFATSSRSSATSSPIAPSVVIPEASPADLPTTPSPSSKTQRTRDSRQTVTSLRFSVTGMITAELPLSVSKVRTQLELSFAPIDTAQATPSDTTVNSLNSLTPKNSKSYSPAPTKSFAFSSSNSILSKTPRMTDRTAYKTEPPTPPSLVTGSTSPATEDTAVAAHFKSSSFSSATSQGLPADAAATSTTHPPYFLVPINNNSSSPLATESNAPPFSATTFSSPTATATASGFSPQSSTSGLE